MPKQIILRELKAAAKKNSSGKITKPATFTYKDKKTESNITNKDTLDYITRLVIPPAYQHVQIYYPGKDKKEPKVKYMGIDDKGRPQFIYAAWWGKDARKKKFQTVIKFGEALPRINAEIKRQLSNSRWSKDKISALILRIISMCYFRVGNTKYEELYQSHGISTIGIKHTKFSSTGVHFQFIGKKGVENTCTIVDPTIIKTLKNLIDARKKSSTSHKDPHLFMYKEGAAWQHIKHTDVNNFLKKFDSSFSSKLFRTYDTNIMLINRLTIGNIPSKESHRKKEVVKALDEVSTLVHNTRAICKKDYADPAMLELYISHPRKFKTKFYGDKLSSERKFINWLKETKK